MQTPDQLLCNRGIINQSLIKTRFNHNRRQWIQHPAKGKMFNANTRSNSMQSGHNKLEFNKNKIQP